MITLTFGLAYLWGNHPELFFKPPEAFSVWLVELYGSSGGEELADLELLYVFACSFILSLTLVTGGYLLRGFVRKRVG